MFGKQLHIEQIEDEEGRAGLAMFYSKGNFYLLGGEENTAKNWMQIKENARKSQLQMAGIEEQNRKRSQSTQPLSQSISNTSALGFNLGGNRGAAGGAKSQAKLLDNYLIFNVGNLSKIEKTLIIQKTNNGKRKSLKANFPLKDASLHGILSVNYSSIIIEFIDPRFLLHGGQIINNADKKNKSQADLYLFDVETESWKRFFVFDQPTARDQHTLTKIGQDFYIYGGNVSPENLVLDELWHLSLEHVPWNTKQVEIPGIVWEKIPNNQTDQSQVPGKLRGHKVVAHPDQVHLMLFGGQSPDYKCHNTLFFFNTQTKQWKSMQTKGSQPPPRCHHQMLALGDSMIAVFGGIHEEALSAKESVSLSLLNDLHILNIQEMHWIQPITGGVMPNPRYGHVMANGQQSNEVYIFGGLNEDFQFQPKDLYLLYETSTQSDKNWKIIEDLDLNSELLKNLEKADWENEVQQQKIAEVEASIKKIKDEKAVVEEDCEYLEEKQEKVTKEVDEESVKWITYLGNRESSRNRDSRYCDQLKQLVDSEHEYRKFFQQKCMMLTDIFKNMENLLINIDKAVVQVLDKDDGTIMDEEFSQEFKKIETERNNHRQCLVELSGAFNKLNSEEEEIQRKIEQMERQAEIDRVMEENMEKQEKEKEKIKKKSRGSQLSLVKTDSYDY